MIFMRHSIRLDESHPEQDWSDNLDRPYDTPISDFQLPVRQARELKESGYVVKTVAVSPFRRCLQTAAIVCKELGIDEVHVDYGLSEVMNSAKFCGEDVSEMIYLSDEKMQEVLGNDVRIVSIGGHPPPSIDEFVEESMDRYAATIQRVSTCFPDEEYTLLVSHGYGVSAFAERWLNPSKTAYIVDECGFIVAGADRSLQHYSRVSLL